MRKIKYYAHVSEEDVKSAAMVLLLQRLNRLRWQNMRSAYFYSESNGVVGNGQNIVFAQLDVFLGKNNCATRKYKSWKENYLKEYKSIWKAYYDELAYPKYLVRQSYYLDIRESFSNITWKAYVCRSIDEYIKNKLKYSPNTDFGKVLRSENRAFIYAYLFCTGFRRRLGGKLCIRKEDYNLNGNKFPVYKRYEKAAKLMPLCPEKYLSGSEFGYLYRQESGEY